MENQLCFCDGRKISGINYVIYLVSVVPFIFLSSFVVSSIIIEKFIWRPLLKKSLAEGSDEFFDEEPPAVVYTEKYPLTEKDLEVEETKDDSYKFRSILETTPSGLVIMKYDVDQEAWNYWADKKNNITFDELDTVCRRYCLTYGCAFLYKDRKLDIENQKKELEQEEERKEMEKHDKREEDSDDDVFVKLKETKSEKKKVVSATISNKFKYQGEIDKFPGFHVVYEKRETKKDIGWAAWKSLM